MPQTRDNGAKVPVNSDAYNLAGDLATMGDSLSVITTVTSQAQRDGLTKFYGRTVRRADLNGALEYWDNTQWTAPPVAFAQYVASVSIGVVNAGATVGPLPQTFVAGRFTVAPIVLVSSDQTRINAAVANVSTTGFDLYLSNWTGAASSNGFVRFIATQMSPTAASA